MVQSSRDHTDPHLEGEGDERLAVEVEQVEAEETDLHLHVRLSHILPLTGGQHLRDVPVKCL